MKTIKKGTIKKSALLTCTFALAGVLAAKRDEGLARRRRAAAEEEQAAQGGGRGGAARGVSIPVTTDVCRRSR